MAGAVWRNPLGARGGRGIAYLDPLSLASSSPSFRRSINLVGREVINFAKIDVDKEEAKDDRSGVHGFPPKDVDKYVGYQEVMLDVVGYLRKELVRLEVSLMTDHAWGARRVEVWESHRGNGSNYRNESPDFRKRSTQKILGLIVNPTNLVLEQSVHQPELYTAGTALHTIPVSRAALLSTNVLRK